MKRRGHVSKLPRFIAELCETGNVTHSCRASGIPNTKYVYALAERDPEFAKTFHEAQRLGVLALEDEARRRAFQGWLEPVVYQGKVQTTIDPETGDEVPVSIRKFSDTLLIFLLKGAMPEKYRENVKVEHDGSIGVDTGLDLSQLDGGELRELRSLLEKAKRREPIDVTPQPQLPST